MANNLGIAPAKQDEVAQVKECHEHLIKNPKRLADAEHAAGMTDEETAGVRENDIKALQSIWI